MNWWLLAVSEKTDFFFHILVIPLSLYMIYSGYRGAKNKQVVIHHRMNMLTGTQAQLAGLLKIGLGVLFLALAFWSLAD